MKGAELPINTLIIIVIAVVVLIALIVIFYNVYNPSKQGIDLETAKNNACQVLQSMVCSPTTDTIKISNFDADKDDYIGTQDTGIGWTTNSCAEIMSTAGDNLAALCECYYSVPDDTECKTKVCRCPE